MCKLLASYDFKEGDKAAFPAQLAGRVSESSGFPYVDINPMS
jgi:hypothetical protein